MDSNKQMTQMSQEIFNTGLSTETISVYLAVCSFIDGGIRPGVDKLMEVWNSTPESLRSGLDQLVEKNIIETVDESMDRKNKFGLTDPKLWSL